jgi:hypothetical protein
MWPLHPPERVLLLTLAINTAAIAQVGSGNKRSQYSMQRQIQLGDYWHCPILCAAAGLR